MANKILIIFICVLMVGCSKSQTLTDINDQRIDVGNKILIINYWAIWCAPCRKEIPEFNRLQQQIITQDHQNVVLLAISFDGLADDKLQQQAKDLHIAFPILSKEAAANLMEQLKLQKPKGLPATFLINQQGKLVKTLLGEQTLISITSELNELGIVL